MGLLDAFLKVLESVKQAHLRACLLPDSAVCVPVVSGHSGWPFRISRFTMHRKCPVRVLMPKN